MLVHTIEPLSGTVLVAQPPPAPPVTPEATIKTEIKTEDMEGIIMTEPLNKTEETEISVEFKNLAITEVEKTNKSSSLGPSNSAVRQRYRELDSNTAGGSSAARRQRTAVQPYGQRPQARAHGNDVCPSKPAPTDPSTWPESTLDPFDRISAGNARKFYRLSQEELAGLRFIVKASRNKPYAARWNPMHLYKTYEVERLAWEKHGGPDGWKWETVPQRVNQALEELLNDDSDEAYIMGDGTGCYDVFDNIRAAFAYVDGCRAVPAKKGRKRSCAADAQDGVEGSEDASSSTASKRKHAGSQNQDEDAEGTPPKKGRKVSGKAARPKKPAPTDESIWPESKLIEDRTITKQELDAAELKYTTKRSGNGRGAFWKPMHLYVEHEVERLAWKKHGGPEGWKWYLDKLRATHEKQHPNKPFPHPGQIDERLARAFYAPIEAEIYDGKTHADPDGDYEYRWDDDCCETCAKIQALFHG
ncbi:hypothetical protein EWM64_g1535 [Hericium alpestre]|uniref:Uncharacterized protein n=1 Tax=Hericium alpestre TaxID=135208 RepID=A0A4Z0A848_9AGAM|nr:hypothetical protein EWM64_g1535 [Hericium alpestre]